MNWSNLLWIPYAAAHTAAATFSTFLEIDLIRIQRSGLWAWAVPGVCLTLLALDLTGRLSLRGSMPCWERRNRTPRETKRRPCWSRGVRWG